MSESKHSAIIQFDGKDYTLEFSRRTAVEAQKRGFRALDLGDPNKMLAAVLDLFQYSFLMHHPELDIEDIDKILDEGLGGTISTELLERLSDSYGDSLSSLVTEGESKNGRATVIL